jgi:UDP-N-acetylenolpyruvoylglucosamine reductase
MNEGSEKKYLFLGVGGMGMAPLACWMSQAGYSITGYDARLPENVRRHLDEAGVSLREFVFEEHLGDFSTVVHSSALRPDHPLLSAARAAGLRCVRRGQMLARIAEGRKLIAVVGSHGKTTTSGMIAYGMLRGGVDANYILGGLFGGPSLPPFGFSESPWLVAEVDESDGTIEDFSPESTLLLNIDWDHADHYGAAAELEATFAGLAQRTRQQLWLPEGVDLGDFPAKRVTQIVREPVFEELGPINADNASAAMAVLRSLSDAKPRDLLQGFPGMARRQTALYENDSLTLIEDYAHHPTEVRILLESLRQHAGGRRLIAVFQPHRYSRTRQFKSEFASALSLADWCYLLPVYAAHEDRLEGGCIEDLAACFESRKPEILQMEPDSIDALVEEMRREPTLLAFVGAGDIEDFAAACCSRLREWGNLDAACMDFLNRRFSPDGLVKAAEPLAPKTTMRIGGAARLYAEPANLADLAAILRAAELFGISYLVIGRGSNLLIADEGYDGILIRLSSKGWRAIEQLGPGRIWSAAGVRLKEICGFAAKSGLAGFEFLEGIPGAVGGALRMNAGAMGGWMFDLVERVQFIDSAGVYQDWAKEDFHFGYRKVEEISGGLALGAILKAPATEEESCIRGRIDTYSSSRKESQPRGPSAGCIFKNPEGNYAGKLIDEHGLKGLRVGGAQVSEVHGNFIVNQGGATAGDVIELVRRIRAKVKADSGYELEPEVLLVGKSWKDVLEEPLND